MTLLRKTLTAFIFSATALFISNQSMAQVSDPGFEKWDSLDLGFFKNYLPEGWGDFTNHSCETEGKPWAITRSTDARSGSYAIQLKNIALESSFATTLMTRSGPPDEFNNKIPVNARHSKLEGYYKYSSPGNDTFTISVLMMKGENFIGFGEYIQSGKTDSYQKFSISIKYVVPASEIPDSAMISFTAGSDNYFTEGSTLLLDDVNFNLSSGLGHPGTELNAQASIWPNPAESLLNLQVKGELKGPVTVELVNLVGQVVKHIEYTSPGGEIQDAIDLTGLPKGLLFVKITDKNGSKALRVVHQ